MKHEDKTLKEFVKDCINLYFRPLRNENFIIPFSLFLIGIIPYCISFYFNINVFITELVIYLIIISFIYFMTRVFSVLIIGVIFSLSYSFLWYITYKIFI